MANFILELAVYKKLQFIIKKGKNDLPIWKGIWYNKHQSSHEGWKKNPVQNSKKRPEKTFKKSKKSVDKGDGQW